MGENCVFPTGDVDERVFSEDQRICILRGTKVFKGLYVRPNLYNPGEHYVVIVPDYENLDNIGAEIVVDWKSIGTFPKKGGKRSKKYSKKRHTKKRKHSRRK